MLALSGGLPLALAELQSQPWRPPKAGFYPKATPTRPGAYGTIRASAPTPLAHRCRWGSGRRSARHATVVVSRIRDNTIDVLADLARNLGAMDAYVREMHLGLGCAIENMAIAAGPNGYIAEVVPVEGSLADACRAARPGRRGFDKADATRSGPARRSLPCNYAAAHQPLRLRPRPGAPCGLARGRPSDRRQVRGASSPTSCWGEAARDRPRRLALGPRPVSRSEQVPHTPTSQ